MAITDDPTPEEMASASDTSQHAPPTDAELSTASDAPAPPTDDELSSAQDAPVKQPLSAGQTYLGGFENALSTATAGLSKIAEQHPEYIPGPLGIAARTLKAAGETTPEKVQAREQNLPLSVSIPSTVVGAGGFGALAGPGLFGLLPEMTGGSGVAARIATAATEGAAYNTTKGAASREAMGDPALDAQKMVADAKMGALWGAGTGALFESAAPLVNAIFRGKGYNAGTGTSEAPSNPELPPPPGGIPPGNGEPELVNSIPPNTNYVDSTPVPKTGIQATNLKEIQAMNDAARARGEAIAMPQQAVIWDSAKNIPTKYPVTVMQFRSLDDQLSRDAYLATLVNPNGSGKPMLDREALQRNEWNGLTNDTIQSIAPNTKLTADENNAGGKITAAFSKQYKNENDLLKPEFEKLDEAGVNPLSNVLAQPGPLEDAIPGVTGNLRIGEDGLSLKPWKPSDPYSEDVHSALNSIIESANDPKMTISGVKNVRSNLDTYLDNSSTATEHGQISGLKKGLMDYMQNAINENPNIDLKLRDTMRRYAINQQNREVIEKTFGSSVGATNFGNVALKNSKQSNESILGKIFKNSGTAEAARNLLPPEDYKEALANFLTSAKNDPAVTKDGVFSSHKFGTFLDKNRYALNVAFKDNPEILTRLKRINAMTRILPDSPPSNPSGTAKTLANLMPNLMKSIGVEDVLYPKVSVPLKGAHELWKIFQRIRDEGKINSQLGAIDAVNAVHSKIAKTAARVSNQISDDAKNIFTGLRGAGYSLAPLGDYDKKSKRVRDLASSPNDMIDHMTNVTSAIHEAAPDVAQGIHSSMAAAIGFLNQKLPKPTQELPLSAPWNPSNHQKQTFNRYYQTVDDPLSALKRVKNGSLNAQDMEALQAVHPNLLDEMKMNVMQNIKKEKAHTLPSGTKIALSKFLGQPLDENMIPSSIQANQASFTEAPQPKVTVKGTKNLNMANRSAGKTDES